MDDVADGLIAGDGRIRADEAAVADGEEIGRRRDGIGLDDRAMPNFRAEQTEIQVEKRTAGEQAHRRRRHQRAHEPEAEIAQAPHREARRLPAPDEQPLHNDGKRT